MIDLPYFAADDIRRALPMPRAIAVMRDAFRALHAGLVTMPVRLGINTPDGVCLFMPAYIQGPEGGALGQKVVSVFGGNRARGLPTIHALVTLFDARTGAPLALLEGTALTALRTGAVTGLATDLLAAPDADVLTVFGAGGQAAHQIEAVCAVRPIQQVNILSRGDSARALADRMQAQDPSRRYAVADDRERAVRDADVVVCVTTAIAPLFDARWLRPGAHVNMVGAYRPDMREVGADLLNRAVVVVDQREAALHEAGDLLIPIAAGTWSADRIAADLGELASGASPVGHDPAGITAFKSCGLAVEDIAAAHAVLSHSRP